jgi:hypothetical protein
MSRFQGRHICLVMLTLSLGACTSVKTVSITSKPTGAMVRIGDRNVGETPVTADIDFEGKPHVFLAAAKEGHLPEEIILTEDAHAVKEGHVKVALMEDEAWKVTTVSEATNTWLRVQIDPSINAANAWQKLIDTVTTRYANLEQLDEASGYVRSADEVRSFMGRRGTYSVRTAFLASLSSREPLVYKFKIESRITDESGAWHPYARVFKEDATLLEELQDRLGAKSGTVASAVFDHSDRKRMPPGPLQNHR